MIMNSSNGNSMSVIYDQYVYYYNQAGKSINYHIPILAEFYNVQEVFSERVNELKQDFKELIDSLEEILDEKIEEKGGVKSNDTSQSLGERKNKLLSKLRFYIYYDHISSFEEVEEYIFNLLSIFYDQNEDDVEFKMIKIYMNASKEKVLKFKSLQIHEVTLANLKRKIVDQYYPDQLDRYENLSEEGKNEITSKENRVGAPLSKDVPQEEIEKIVADLIVRHNQGEIIKVKFKRQKRAFSVIHEGGVRDGNANINQIFKYFETVHPDRIKISDRQFKERIKKALPENMK